MSDEHYTDAEIDSQPRTSKHHDVAQFHGNSEAINIAQMSMFNS
jgi:hypothetical protein